MSLFFYDNELSVLMENFYTLTGIRIVLFDNEFNEVLSYPSNGNSFCSLMRTNADFDTLCRKSDRISFEKCRKTHALCIYRCHAGLIEAAAPIIQNNAIIGYIMFGQITDIKDKDAVYNFVNELCQKYPLSVTIPNKLKKIKYKSSKQIIATSKILDACTSYIMLKEMIKPQNEQLIEMISNYVDIHMHERIYVEDICGALDISRTQLYEETKQYTNGGIASFIKIKRLNKAKELVTGTSMSVSEISDKTGFSDYNYFLRVFKKHYGISPKKMRLGMLPNLIHFR